MDGRVDGFGQLLHSEVGSVNVRVDQNALELDTKHKSEISALWRKLTVTSPSLTRSWKRTCPKSKPRWTNHMDRKLRRDEHAHQEA